jgi:hypothetical protein
MVAEYVAAITLGSMVTTIVGLYVTTFEPVVVAVTKFWALALRVSPTPLLI